MQIRIRHLYRAAPETVRRATNAFAAPIENMGIDHVVISDSVPVGRLQRASTPENLRSRLQKSGCNRYWKYILQKADLQEKNVFFQEDTGISAIYPGFLCGSV